MGNSYTKSNVKNANYINDLNMASYVIKINEWSIFLKESEILEERENVISEAKEKLFLKREDAILAMIYYKWNLDKLDDWYENIEENKVKAGIELSKITEKNMKKKGILSNGNNCLICQEKKKNNNFLGLNCNHQFCITCWEEYLKEKIKYPLEALYAHCPQNGCTCIVYEHLYSKLLKDKDSLEKLNKAINKNFIDRNDDVKKCPNEKCPYYIKSNRHYAREINCKCGISFCYKCSKESHSPFICDIIQKWDIIKNKYFIFSSDEEKNDKWLKANTKECPNCHLKIEKSYGCYYMLCDQKVGGCGHAFCFICGEDWEKHGQDHFYCNKYKVEMQRKKQLNEELEKVLYEEEILKNKGINFDKTKNERYIFYYIRYKNYEKLIEELNNNLRDNLNEKINVLLAIHGWDKVKLEFIIDALETLIKANKFLKYSYIFGYFMKDTDRKDIFENSQGILEYNTENLYQIFAYGKLNTIIELDPENFEILFLEYEKSVTTFAKIIEKFKKEFINDIENKFILDLDNELLEQKL